MNMTVNVTQTSPHPVEEIKFDQLETELRKLIDSLSMDK
jgi:hypothetical protein